ncbi:MAG TPA: hypothetical protein DCW68_02105 [Rhodospirillaceae bacterium]|nr:MAG: hypothetical protein A2018_05070 [Alphaproteobacteria bacterium GWF2_58_20]HAU28888.1 hypothetical protein [Rhodospirillaceae bacterium]
MSSPDNTSSEPSIEEILDSIRKIISEDGEGMPVSPSLGTQEIPEPPRDAEETPPMGETVEEPRMEAEEQAPGMQANELSATPEDEPLELNEAIPLEPAEPETQEPEKREPATQEPLTPDDNEDILDLTDTVQEAKDILDLSTESALPEEPMQTDAPENILSVEDAGMEPVPEISPEIASILQEPAEKPEQLSTAPTTEDIPVEAVETKIPQDEPETAEVSIPDQPQVPLEVAMPDATSQTLISETAEAEAIDALSKLIPATPPETEGGDVPGGHVTVDQMVREMIRPMLREWLDANLPQMVEKIVSREIEKLSRKAGL